MNHDKQTPQNAIVHIELYRFCKRVFQEGACRFRQISRDDTLKPQTLNRSSDRYSEQPKLFRRQTMQPLSGKNVTLALVLALAIIFVATTASAETLLAYATRSGNESGTNTAAVDLDDNHATGLSFKTTGANKLIKITYNAECGVVGAARSWQSVTIFIDGDTQANPASGTNFAFCTADGSNNYLWKGAVRQSFLVVPTAGTHNVHVQVDLNGGATQWWLGDTSIVVEQK